MTKSTKIIILIFFITIISFSGMIIYTNSSGTPILASETGSNPNGEMGSTDPNNDDNKLGIGDDSEDDDGKPKNTNDKEQGITKNQVYSQKLVAKKTKNILVVGLDKSNAIYDSMGIINIDEDQSKIKIIMFPRDIYVDYSENIKNQISEVDPNYWRKSNHGVYRINNMHNVGIKLKYEDGRLGLWAMNFIAAYMKEVFGIEVDSYVKIDTKGFVELVDLFGGVDINVPIRMKYKDPYQNLYIDLKPGLQHLNGNQAEGFVRFRQGKDDNGKIVEIGDFKRKENQILFLEAFFNQHANVSNLNKANGLFNTIKKNIATNISASGYTQYISLIRKAVDKGYTIEKCTIEGEVCSINGDSYVRLATLEE